MDQHRILFISDNYLFSIYVDASNWDLNSGDGIISDSDFCSPNLVRADHAVNLVGWGFDNSTNQEYWIIRNHWGESWVLFI